MALDLSQTVRQIDYLAQSLNSARDDRAQRLGHALRAMRESDASEVKRKVDSSRGRPFLCAGLYSDAEGLAARNASEEVPQDFCVVSVDGSHIDVDRHIPVRCYLINVGGCALTYGSQPDARLFNRPRLHTQESELYLSNPESSNESVPVEGALVGLKRTVEEIRELASVAEGLPREMPALALIDGSLVLWGLAGRGYQPFVRDEILRGGFLPALDRFEGMARDRRVAVAAYVSLPQSAEVVNTLRLHLCTRDTVECTRHCNGHRSGLMPCDLVNGFLDRHLFQELLGPGERSALFITNSSISRDDYGPHRVHFYYMNTGDEIARVEVPQWVADRRDLLDLSHALILDQCRRGMGYPVAISEAHEQAVVTGQDRELFKQMLEDALQRNRLPVYTSEKNRSKRMRWL
jgi:hypothetical protein